MLFIAQSLLNSKWICKYHIVFAPKYRKKLFYKDKRLEIREIIRKLCEWKGMEIIEGEICPRRAKKKCLNVMN